jgi:HSP20 family protein
MPDMIPWTTGELGRFRQEMDNLFERFFEGFPRLGLTRRMGLTPSIDLSETKDNIVVKAELPGIDRKDIDISLYGNVLSIKGEKKQEKVDEGEDFHRIERSYGTFSRNVSLPCEVEEKKITATYEQGVLKIRLPKCEPSKPKRIKIDVE